MQSLYLSSSSPPTWRSWIMHTTLNNATMPIRLQPEAAPTVDGLISQIDPWVLYHLRSIISSDVHYENQLYGPINSFIGSISLQDVVIWRFPKHFCGEQYWRQMKWMNFWAISQSDQQVAYMNQGIVVNSANHYYARNFSELTSPIRGKRGR